MQILKASKLKRDGFIIIFIPILLIVTLQMTATHLYYSWPLLAVLGVAIFCWCLHRFFNQLEEVAWQKQLNDVLCHVTAPILIADMKHQITYVNDSFCHSPVANILSKFNNLDLVELLISQEKTADIVERTQKMTQLKESLDSLNCQIKKIVSYQEKNFEWILVPLCSSSGKRWGTLVECRDS